MITHNNHSNLLVSPVVQFKAIGNRSFHVSETVRGLDALIISLPGYLLHSDDWSIVPESKVMHSLSESKNMLLEMVHSGVKLPKIIVYEGRIRFAELRQFYAFLEATKELRNIPFVYHYVGEGVFTKDELYDMVKCRLFDDVISQNENAQTLMAGAEILGSMKEMKAGLRVPAAPVAELHKSQNKLDVDLVLKRALDIVVSSVALLVLMPLMLLIALCIFCESRGPIFYISKRAGRGFDVFNFYKFRTMVVDADQKLDEYAKLNQYAGDADNCEGPKFFKIDNDPRVTRLGCFLRKTSLDELPQLLNVLKGDMSLVGNRPLPLYEAATLTCNEWAERFLAPAGITGLWQISKRGKANMSVNERVDLDIEYSRNFGFFYDLRIMAKTPSAMFQDANV
ncbi:sugar transferase [Phnomibacter sp. MR]|uniref:sugar transferase n=1 Tax=Phnomibacter sp. MR TaxID=3042318 RepID=UPI003A8050AA